MATINYSFDPITLDDQGVALSNPVTFYNVYVDGVYEKQVAAPATSTTITRGPGTYLLQYAGLNVTDLGALSLGVQVTVSSDIPAQGSGEVATVS